MGLSHTVSGINGENCIIFPPRVFNQRASHWNFVTAVGFKTQNDDPTRMSKKCDDKYIRLDAVPALDRWTNWRNCWNNIALRMHCMLMHNNKRKTTSKKHWAKEIKIKQFQSPWNTLNPAYVGWGQGRYLAYKKQLASPGKHINR